MQIDSYTLACTGSWCRCINMWRRHSWRIWRGSFLRRRWWWRIWVVIERGRRGWFETGVVGGVEGY